MKKTFAILLALSGFALANTYTTSTPDKTNQGNYYGFALALNNTTHLTTTIPGDVTTVNLDSLTLLTRTGALTSDMKVAVYTYVGDSRVGTYLGSSTSTGTSAPSDSYLTLSFSGISLDTSATYQFLFVNATATDETLSTFEGYRSVGMQWGVAVTDDFDTQIPPGWGTYKATTINSWEGNHLPVVTLTVSTPTPAVPEPATATLSLLALAGLAARRRRK